MPADNTPPTPTTTAVVEEVEERRPAVDNSFMTLPEPQLSDEEDRALRAVVDSLRKNGATADDLRWFDDAKVWTEARADYPVLSAYTDAELKRAYFALKSSPLAILFGTPLGPVVVVNVLASVFHFSWCDTPFRDLLSSSCAVDI